MNRTDLLGAACAALCLAGFGSFTPATAQTAAPAPTTAAPAPAPYKAPSPSASPAPEAPATPPAGHPPAPDDALTAVVRALAPSIEDVQVVGPWTDGEKNGVWRTMMMQVPNGQDRYRFFVQQLQKDAEGMATIATHEISEIATLKGAVVGYRADEPAAGDESGLTLFFDVVPSDGEVAETYELNFSKDGTYTFGTATN